MYYELLSDDDWRLLPDPDNRGRDAGWMERIPDGARRVTVPSCIEETEPRTDGVVWYWKRFRVADLPPEHHFRLGFHGVDYFAEAWLNGHYLGGNESGLLPFSFDVTAALCEGENFLAVRVIDPAYGHSIEGYQLGSIPGGRQHEDPWAPGHFHYNYGGILQDVFLDGRAFQWVEDVFIHPNVADSSIDVHIELGDRSGLEETLTIEATVCPDFPEHGDPIARVRRPVRLGKGRRDVHLSLFLPKVVRWEIHNAYLYRLNVMLLRGSDVLDIWTDRFGMREFSFENGHVTVNGRPILLRGFLYNQIWPTTLGRPFGKMARRDIEIARDAGANLMRMFSKSPCKATLDACDEMGMLAHVETLAARHLSEGPLAPRANRLTDLMLRQVRRDRNRACVLWWCCLSNVTGELLTYTTEQLLPQVRQLDPTRIILNADNPDPLDSVQWLPDEALPHRHFDPHHWRFAPETRQRDDDPFRHLRGRPLLGEPDPDAPPLYLSEWGAPHGSQWAVLLETYANYREDLEDATLFRELVLHHRQQYAQLNLEERGFPTFDAFLTAGKRAAAKWYEDMLIALWGNPKVVGHCLNSFEDSGYEISGVVDIWRNPKVGTYQKIREMNSTAFLNVDWKPRSFYVGDPIHLDVTLVNEHVIPAGDYVLNVLLQDPDQVALWNLERPVTVTGDLIQPLFAESLEALSVGVPHRLTVTLRRGDGREAHNVAAHVRTLRPFERIPRRHFEFAPLHVWEREKRLSRFLTSLGIPHEWIERPEDVPAHGLIVAAEPSLAPEDLGIWRAILDRWDEGTPLAVLDHRLLASETDAVGHLPTIDGWRPRLIRDVSGYAGSRYITNHPIFSGLPKGCSIGSTDVYTRLSPVDTWAIDDRPNSVECDIAAFHADIEKREPYTADACILSHGKRRIFLSTLNLMANVGEDPATDLIILNLLEFLSKADDER